MRQVDLDLKASRTKQQPEDLVCLDEPTRTRAVEMIASAIVVVVRAEREREVRDECAVKR